MTIENVALKCPICHIFTLTKNVNDCFEEKKIITNEWNELN